MISRRPDPTWTSAYIFHLILTYSCPLLLTILLTINIYIRPQTYPRSQICTLNEFHSCQILFPLNKEYIFFTYIQAAKIEVSHIELAKVSFNEILDLTADVYQCYKIFEQHS